MILIVGGTGFVGSNTAEALLSLGEDCVITYRNHENVADFLKPEHGKRLFTEPLDVTDNGALLELGKKYHFTGIVHLATGGLPLPPGSSAQKLMEDIHTTITGLASIFDAAQAWGVNRVTIAGAPVVYNGAQAMPWREAEPLPLTAGFSMEAAKKCIEILSSYLSLKTGVDYAILRLPAMYGPGYDPSRPLFVGRLVHAAAKGEEADLEGLMFGGAYADDAGDQCYIKDAARGIALLQTAHKLNHHVYNIAGGQAITNQAIADAVKTAAPGFAVTLPTGNTPNSPLKEWWFDITRIHSDTGYEPRFNITTGVADYLAWLKAGHER